MSNLCLIWKVVFVCFVIIIYDKYFSNKNKYLRKGPYVGLRVEL